MKLFKKENILLILLGIFVARAGFFGIYPFSLGFFTAVYIENRHNKWIMIPVIIGVISVITPLESLTYIFAIISIITK